MKMRWLEINIILNFTLCRCQIWNFVTKFHQLFFALQNTNLINTIGIRAAQVICKVKRSHKSKYMYHNTILVMVVNILNFEWLLISKFQRHKTLYDVPWNLSMNSSAKSRHRFLCRSPRDSKEMEAIICSSQQSQWALAAKFTSLGSTLNCDRVREVTNEWQLRSRKWWHDNAEWVLRVVCKTWQPCTFHLCKMLNQL